MITRKQLAEKLNVSERTIDRYRKLGMPANVTPTGSVRFDEDKVMAWLFPDKESE